MHKYDLRVLGGKKRLLFPLFYLSEPNKSNYIKAFSPQNTRFVVGSWYLTWFVKFSFITGLERKYVCIKLPFFTSIHTAEVLEEDETCTMHSGFWHAFHISRSLVLTCASGVLFPWPEVTSCIEFWKCFRAHWWRRKSVLRTLTSPSAFPAIPPSPVWALLLMDSGHWRSLPSSPTPASALVHDLLSVCSIFLGTSLFVMEAVILDEVQNLPRPLQQQRGHPGK